MFMKEHGTDVSGESNMIPFRHLMTTQLSVRNHEQVEGMADFIRDGGVFDQKTLDEYARKSRSRCKPPLVQINKFEDDQLFLLDGHHRAIGILEGGREFFRTHEYNLLSYSYKDFTDIVFTWPNGKWMGWTTPFDPREQVRLPDIKNFKDEVKRVYEQRSPDAAVSYIEKNPELYLVQRHDMIRPVDTIEQLRNMWCKELAQIVDLQRRDKQNALT